MGSSPDVSGQPVSNQVLILVFVPSHVYDVVLCSRHVAPWIEVEHHGCLVAAEAGWRPLLSPGRWPAVIKTISTAYLNCERFARGAVVKQVMVQSGCAPGLVDREACLAQHDRAACLQSLAIAICVLEAELANLK